MNRTRTLLVAMLTVALTTVSTPAVTAQDGGPAVRGTVVSEADAALEGVCVEIETAEGQPIASTVTDASGEFAFETVADGAYLVGFNLCAEHLPGWAGTWWSEADDPVEAREVIVSGGGSSELVDAVLAPAGALSGTVLDGDEPTEGAETEEPAPLQGICVVATEEDTNATLTAITGVDGTYRIGNLPDGQYAVTFQDCDEPRSRVGQLYPGITAHDDPRGEVVFSVFRVRPGQEVADIDAELVTGGLIEGTVDVAHTGQELSLLCVAAYDTQTTEEEERHGPIAVTGIAPEGGPAQSEGDYQLSDLPEGEYEVVFNDPACSDDGYETVTTSGEVAAMQTTTVSVSAGEVVSGVDQTLRPKPSIGAACPLVLSEDAAAGLDDVDEANLHRAAIMCAVERSIARGTAAGRYSPSNPVRRDQMASFIARMLEAAEVVLPEQPRDHFTDDDGNVHELAINQLAELGIVLGRSEDRYAPAGLVQRSAMTTFLVRAYAEAAPTELLSPAQPFTDVAGNTHESNINKAASAGIAAGTTATTFSPSLDVRRDQMASFIMRTLDRITRDDPSLSSDPVPVQEEVGAAGHVARGSWKGHWTTYGGRRWYISDHTRVTWPWIRVKQMQGTCNSRFGISKFYLLTHQTKWRATWWCLQDKESGGIGISSTEDIGG
jgi:hypothetical protein